MATVTFEHVNKAYKAKTGEVRAVDDLCLGVADRELIVLVGPSGCGKTTTLRLLAGLEEVDAGEIRIGDRTVNRVAPKDRDVAMVFQNYALYPHMTVFKNMAFGLKMRRVPRAEIQRKVHDVAGMLGIEHLLDRKPAALSGGERQRVAVGRAIVRKPRVFLFDEPLSNLDAKLRVHMRTEIKSLHRKLETTVLYVTHDQEEAMTLGDRLVIMDKGVVQQCGAPLEVYNAPANRFVAGFVGTPSMNFLEGRIEDQCGATLVVANMERLRLPPELATTMAQHVGRAAVLGVRPEHLRLDAVNGRPTDGKTPAQREDKLATIKASVTVVEPLGDSVNVHFALSDGRPMVARVPPTVSLSPGQDVNVRIEMSGIHLFAADETGQRLT